MFMSFLTTNYHCDWLQMILTVQKTSVSSPLLQTINLFNKHTLNVRTAPAGTNCLSESKHYTYFSDQIFVCKIYFFLSQIAHLHTF